MRRFIVAVVTAWLVTTLPLGVQAQEVDGQITGLIINEISGEPIVNMVGINAYDSLGSLVATSGPTDADGGYLVGPLPPGDYKLEFVDARLTGLATEWWNNKPDQATADVVAVVAGETTTGIDFQVAPPPPVPGGTITGRLLLEDGTTVPEGFRLAIQAFRLDGSVGGEGVAWTDASGSYRLGPITPGTYKLMLIDSSWFAFEGVACPCTTVDGAPGLHIAWWPDRADFASAQTVEIELDQSVNANFTLRQVGQIPSSTTSTTPDTLPHTGPESGLVLGAGVAFALGLFLLAQARRSATR